LQKRGGKNADANEQPSRAQTTARQCKPGQCNDAHNERQRPPTKSCPTRGSAFSRSVKPRRLIIEHLRRAVDPDAGDPLVLHAQNGGLIEEGIGRILGQPALDFAQQPMPFERVGTGLELRHQGVVSGALIAEIIVLLRIDVVVIGFGVVDHGQVELMVQEHFLEPRRPFQIADGNGNADRSQLRGDEFAGAPGIGGAAVSGPAKAVGIACLRQQLARQCRIVGIDAGQIDVVRALRRKWLPIGVP
jgi:hypothetical protein